MATGAQMQRDVVALLREHGYDLTFRRPSNGGSYNPATGAVSGGSNADETARVVFLNYTSRDIDGTLVQRGDRKAVMAATYNGTALSKTPQIDDELRGEGDAVRIVSVQTIKSGSTVLAYICQARE
jgi:hypothetical protein